MQDGITQLLSFASLRSFDQLTADTPHSPGPSVAGCGSVARGADSYGTRLQPQRNENCEENCEVLSQMIELVQAGIVAVHSVVVVITTELRVQPPKLFLHPQMAILLTPFGYAFD
jgi:hypothetical protein